jgi:6-phosphogluconolactonase
MIRIFADHETLSRAAATLVVSQAKIAVAQRGRFSVALAGGNTPRRAYELLAGPPFADAAPWDRMHIFWGDERCVPPDDPRNNARMAKEAWLDRVPIPPGQIHPLDCADSPAEAAWNYEVTLREYFAGRPPRLDLVLLGLGDNGHTASLFPGSPVLAEAQHWAAAVFVAEPDLYRVTLTAPFINQAAMVAFLVSGKEKALAIRDVIYGRRDPGRLPAQLIAPPDGELLWLVDRDAAARLPAD